MSGIPASRLKSIQLLISSCSAGRISSCSIIWVTWADILSSHVEICRPLSKNMRISSALNVLPVFISGISWTKGSRDKSIFHASSIWTTASSFDSISAVCSRWCAIKVLIGVMLQSWRSVLLIHTAFISASNTEPSDMKPVWASTTSLYLFRFRVLEKR